MHETISDAHRTRERRRLPAAARLGALAAGIALAAGSVALLPTGQALAATSPGTSIASVDVGSAIAITALTPGFTLTGVPGDTPAAIGAVTMDVFSNNATGYNVTVQAAGPNLVGAIAGNADVIPVTDLSVEETGAGPYLPLSSTAATTVYTQDTPSAATPGDALSNDYEFNTGIPDVTPDTYSVTIDYVATDNP
jgi:hypothetical protein